MPPLAVVSEFMTGLLLRTMKPRTFLIVLCSTPYNVTKVLLVPPMSKRKSPDGDHHLARRVPAIDEADGLRRPFQGDLLPHDHPGVTRHLGEDLTGAASGDGTAPELLDERLVRHRHQPSTQVGRRLQRL